MNDINFKKEMVFRKNISIYPSTNKKLVELAKTKKVSASAILNGLILDFYDREFGNRGDKK